MHNSLAQVVLKIASPACRTSIRAPSCGICRWSIRTTAGRWISSCDASSSTSCVLLARARGACPPALRQLGGRAIKLFLTHAALQARKAQPDVFAEAATSRWPRQAARREPAGFARMGPDGQMAVVVAPRLVPGCSTEPARRERFASTLVPCPVSAQATGCAMH